MEVVQSVNHDQKVAGQLIGRMWRWLKALPEKLMGKVVEFSWKIIKLGQDDPRRVIHSLKVGLALSLVSVLYYYQPLYDNFGVSAMWAVMTVVVVFEFSVGATLGKGLNRGSATLFAGALGIGAHHLADLSGHIGEPILLGFFVFLQAAASTFIRFFPKVKARYDYGLLIFILTFALISVSGFRDDEILEFAHKRLSSVIIGCSASVIISILICPVWAGEDLHNLIAANLGKLGNFLEGFGNEYFTSENGDKEDAKSFMQEYISVLNSKNNEETLANFAKWEPGHGRFQFRHPWNHYLQLGTLTRQCAYRIDALNGYLNTTQIQTSPEIRNKIEEMCTKMSMESGKALKELAMAMKKMTHPSSADSHIENSKCATKNLNSLFKSGIWDDTDLLAVVPLATVASLLIEVVNCTEKISESVYELASMVNFRTPETTVSLEKSELGPSDDIVDCPGHVVITVNDDKSLTPANNIPENGLINTSGTVAPGRHNLGV
ncbi:hypothetical protein Dsin_019646 [Dipteronia sinensis]|uniref:Aluminum-activated malate transporter n=1 Tax=Dipteronia sinensis TaxID=43782 RepID=A0AAE0E2X8_9ROSI|nr:hypothetical protein Dsin_019646 [Dipteronia sinensis]